MIFFNEYKFMIIFQFRFYHPPKKGEIIELHDILSLSIPPFYLFWANSKIFTVELNSMLLTISSFMFWDDLKTFSKSILSSLVFG